MKMLSSQFVSSFSCPTPVPECPSESFLPDPSPDHDHDIQEFWWDDHVCQFPAQFYTLLSPTDYQELFLDDDDDYAFATDDYTFAMDEYAFATDGYAKDESAMLQYRISEQYQNTEQHIYKKKNDGGNILNLKETHMKLLVAARVIVKKCYTIRPYTQSAVLKNVLSDHQHVTEGSYSNIPAIASCNIDFPNPEKLSLMSTNKEMKEKRLTHNSSNPSCGLARRKRGLRGKEEG